MIFQRLSSALPWAAVSAISGYAGWMLQNKHMKQQICRNPGPSIEEAARSSKDPIKVFSALVVQAANLSGQLKMAGATFTDEITRHPTRRSIQANVYSRIVAAATVVALREKNDCLEILLIKNKRKVGKLLPPEGYGKFGPLKYTGDHFSDVDRKGMDQAEELILKGMSVDSAYGQVAAEIGRGKHPYGSYDLTFENTAKREFAEEIGIIPRELKSIYQETTYKPEWGLHTHVSGFLMLLDPDAESSFILDADEVGSAHLISLENIHVEADGSGRVQGFDEIIPTHYMIRFEKAVTAYADMQVEKISHGLITSLKQLQQYAELYGQICPRLVFFGEGQYLSIQAIRDFAAMITTSLHANRAHFSFFSHTGCQASHACSSNKITNLVHGAS
jgi:ADP-ribose pyrophosphatase YjhB (NUDIX family)